MFCGKLINRDSGANIPAGGLFGAGSSQERGPSAGVIARSVFAGGSIGVRQPGEDLQVVVELSQRLQGFAELVIGPAGSGTPLGT